MFSSKPSDTHTLTRSKETIRTGRARNNMIKGFAGKAFDLRLLNYAEALKRVNRFRSGVFRARGNGPPIICLCVRDLFMKIFIRRWLRQDSWSLNGERDRVALDVFCCDKG